MDWLVIEATIKTDHDVLEKKTVSVYVSGIDDIQTTIES
jgi:hypothetical protein